MKKVVQKQTAVAKKPAAIKTQELPNKKNVVLANKKSTALAKASDFESSDGFENVGANDVLLPRLTLLQNTSDQLKKKHALYIDDAEAGQFCDVALNKILPSPLALIPCFYAMVYLEWAPRDSGKGLVRNHGTDASCLDGTERDEDNKNVNKQGNYIAETATYFCMYQDEDGDWKQSFLPLASTQLRSSKRWMSRLKNEKLEREDGSKFTPSMYYRAWLAAPTEESNNKGDWFGWGFEPGDPINEIDPSKELLAVCKEFCRQAKVGLVRGDVEAASREDRGAEGSM